MPHDPKNCSVSSLLPGGQELRLDFSDWLALNDQLASRLAEYLPPNLEGFIPFIVHEMNQGMSIEECEENAR